MSNMDTTNTVMSNDNYLDMLPNGDLKELSARGTEPMMREAPSKIITWEVVSSWAMRPRMGGPARLRMPATV